MIRKFLLFIFIITLSVSAFSQKTILLYGKIRTDKGRSIDLVNISVKGFNIGTVSDQNGKYEIQVPSNTDLTLVFSHIEYETETKKVHSSTQDKQRLNVMMKRSLNILSSVSIRDEAKRHENIVRLSPKIITHLPSAGEGVEALIKTLPGVSSNNELSNQYTVRGGNFDENLIYVNGIQVYRPQLIKTSEQEGLSFINPDLVESIHFSAGGFQARYGDKMSSVLDVKYKRPKRLEGTVSASLLGGRVYLGNITPSRRFSYALGFRYKTTKYLLNTLDTKGNYQPSFLDFQTLLEYDINENQKIKWLGHFARNQYQIIPQSRKTSFGTLSQALGLSIYFEGQELDKYNTLFDALSYQYKKNNTFLDVTYSTYFAQERESYDILGQYFLNELNKKVGSEDVGDSLNNIGIGSYLNHARNRYDVLINSLQHRGEQKINQHKLEWGIQFQNEQIKDHINEWIVQDSAGYSLPFPDTVGYHPSFVPIHQTTNSDNSLSNQRFTSYLQDTYHFNWDSSEYFLNVGVRAHYWTYNQQWFISPRATLSFKPNWDKDFLFRFSIGSYKQSPFYKELRMRDGQLISGSEARAQESIHFVASSDYNFYMWNRSFKFVTEIYYKHLSKITPYSIENVLIRYYPEQTAKGFTRGIDFRLFGEFVPGIDSWASLSFMKSKEDIAGDGNGEIYRPTDQRFNASIYFQDYLPKYPNFRVYLGLNYGKGFPFGPPNSPRYLHTGRMPDFFRTDIGFTTIIKGKNVNMLKYNWSKYFKSIYFTIEVFNLMNKNNTISYFWVNDIQNRQLAVPNFLTGIRFNFKLTFKF